MYIFYCDDDQEDIELFKRVVFKINSNIQCESLTDAEESIAYLAGAFPKPDAIFIDLHMPKLDGLECVIAIKRNKALKKIPLIILSNGLGKAQIEQFNKLGVYRFVSKSTVDDMETSLKHMLQPEQEV